DAMPDDRHGRITLKTANEDGHVVIEVRDDGVGMNQKTIKQIFDPFFTTKRARGGTGLGLAISYKIIEEHGGTISVNSKQGSGTVFRIRIPAGRTHPAAGGGKA
ncbi:MAG: HAMP domain-containing histidine kinase, partial [Candidatus Krumholzibacteriota bacterium]|nr:HAMP domain-containing histidine kinase [Candidatus Krumholzibacteriota bacterium]